MGTLDQLMARYEMGIDDLPMLFFPDEGDRPAIGIDIALFLLWSCSRALLEQELSSRIASLRFDVNCSYADLVRVARASLGDGLRPSDFNEGGRSFARRYLRPGWQFRYHTDLDILFPDETTYAEIPESLATIGRVFELIDARWQTFRVTTAG